ncbi:class F sortase [Iamia sp.]|uniref:class F sortase n=1 Tax=Iamia sp. TaxID=2722710 RepID=UPI002C4FF1F8|nr:class F sortase [Iamia sp.]HXH55711.1 class F sortase [Iamia sp.]
MQVAVPAIGVDASVTRLGLNPDKSLEVPSTAQDTGWWSGGSVPGTPGPAVIAGHVNLAGETGVFASLDRLGPGDEVTVRLDAGQEVTYRVDRVERHAKDAFPTNDVYGATEGSELRLITCGGAFDPDTGHYFDNVVAFASLVS